MIGIRWRPQVTTTFNLYNVTPSATYIILSLLDFATRRTSCSYSGHLPIVYYDIASHSMNCGYDRHIWILHPWLGHELLVYMDPQCTSCGSHILVSYRYGFICCGKERFSLTLWSIGLLHWFCRTPSPIEFTAWYIPFRPSISSSNLMH